MKTFLHIVPKLPPRIDGIGDYATNLAGELEDQFGVRNLLASAGTESGSDQGESQKDIHHCAPNARALAGLARGLSFDQVILHYSGYGYERRGVPLWLVKALSEFTRERPVPIAVIFHEVWAAGSPWRSAFYLMPLQRWIVRRLHRIARVSVTSTPVMARLINPDLASVEVIPISGNSRQPFSRGDRTRRAKTPLRVIIFGQEHSRIRTVSVHNELLKQLVRRNAIESISLVGAGACYTGADSQFLFRFCAESLIRTVGDVGSQALSDEFSRADLCLSYYPLYLLTKSSAVMAAMANGRPVAIPRGGERHEHIAPVPPVVTVGTGMDEAERLVEKHRSGELQRLGDRAGAWYEGNASWPRVGARFGELIGLARPVAESSLAP